MLRQINYTERKAGIEMKNWKMEKWFALCVATICGFSATATACNLEKDDGPIILKEIQQAKNVILLIGDGMGPNQIKAGELYKGETLYMQQFPYMTMVETRSASAEITDSAAAGTAMATGNRAINGQVALSNDGEELDTIMDLAQSLGKRTGVIATEEIYGATPMTFLSHSKSRDNKDELIAGAVKSGVNFIASDIFDESYIQHFVDNGYTQITNADDISETKAEYVIGAYRVSSSAEYGENTERRLAFDRLITEALEYLSKDEDGFVLMAEGSHIDHGGHNNSIHYMLKELLAFDNGVRAALEWAKDREDTVVIVTADHETGGLLLNEGATGENLFDMESLDGGLTYDTKYYKWTTNSHTATDVCCYINGANIDFSQYSFKANAKIRNTDVFEVIKNLIMI